MGDRTGLPKLDRTNGFQDGRDYMKIKKLKLAEQNDQIRSALRHRNSTLRTDIFKNISINVNGRTQPCADELKRLMLLNGGEYHPYYRYQTTKFMIATNLSLARTKNLRPDDRIVKPEWITDSVKAKCLLPYQDYQLFSDQHQQQQHKSLLFRETSAPSLSLNHGIAKDKEEITSKSNIKSMSSSNLKTNNNNKQPSIANFMVRNPNPNNRFPEPKVAKYLPDKWDQLTKNEVDEDLFEIEIIKEKKETLPKSILFS